MSEVRACDAASDGGDAASNASGAGVAVPVGRVSVAMDLDQHAGSEERMRAGSVCGGPQSESGSAGGVERERVGSRAAEGQATQDGRVGGGIVESEGR